MIVSCQKVYDYIVDYKKKHDGNSPSIREIGAGVGGSSTSHVNYLLKMLEYRHKMIKRTGFKSRNIEVMRGCWLPPTSTIKGKKK